MSTVRSGLRSVAAGLLVACMLAIVARVVAARVFDFASADDALSMALAFGLFLQFLALFFLLRSHDRAAFWCGALAALVGLAGVAGYLLAFNGLNEAAARVGFALVGFMNFHVSAALAVLFCGAGVAVAGGRKRHGFGAEALAASAVLSLLLIPALFLWQSFRVLPDPTGLLTHPLQVPEISMLLAMSVLQFIAACIVYPEGFGLRHRFLPAIAFVVLVTASVHLWLALIGEEQNSIRRETEATAQRLQASLDQHMQVRLEAFHRMAERMQRDDFSSREKWMQDALQYLNDFDSISAIGWITPDSRVHWAVSREKNRYREGEAYAVDPHRAALLHAAEVTGMNAYTPPLQLRSGGYGQLVAIPLQSASEYRGSLVVGFRVSKLIASLVENVAADFAVVASISGEQIFSRISDSTPHPMSKAVTYSLAFDTLGWQITIWPENRYLERNFLWLPGFLLMLGVLSAMLFAFSLYQLEIQRRRSASLRHSEARYRIVAEQTGAVVYDYDVMSGHIDWAGAISDVLGYTPKEFGQIDIDGWERHLHPEDAPRALEALERAQRSVSRYQCEYRFQCKDGNYVRVLDRGVFLPGSDGLAVRMLGKISDVTERYEFEQQLRYLAHYDQPTGLRNRVWFMENAVRQVEASAEQGQPVWFVFLDVDRFRAVNETLGHTVGDLLLEGIARRLETVGGQRGIFARLGGDEFGLCLCGAALDSTSVERFCEELMSEFERPFEVASHSLYVTLSVGVASFPHDGKNAQQVIRAAETAMFRAKQRGRNTWATYEASMSVGASENLEIANALRRALDRNEFHLVFQPRFNLQSGRITGMEALLRWESSELGTVSPATFIPVAEETGLIGPIGWFVVDAAAQAAHQAGSELMAGRRIAINVSARQLVYGDFVSELVQRVQSANASPHWFEIELTESLVMEDPQRARDLFVQLHEAGFTISIDDFGTGYSSLSYLKHFPVDHLKIDRSFVMGLPDNADDASIVKTIVTMGNGLGLKLIAEGIETQAQSEFLRIAGCQEAQGFLFARPMRLEQLMVLLD